jgi:hypothetical protein
MALMERSSVLIILDRPVRLFESLRKRKATTIQTLKLPGVDRNNQSTIEALMTDRIFHVARIFSKVTRSGRLSGIFTNGIITCPD